MSDDTKNDENTKQEESENQQQEGVRSNPLGEGVVSVTGQDGAPAESFSSLSFKAKSLKEKVEDAFEDLRDYLVHILGDHNGVHAVINDAKASIAPHVPEEPAKTETPKE